jgi:hypothetical protein
MQTSAFDERCCSLLALCSLLGTGAKLHTGISNKVSCDRPSNRRLRAPFDVPSFLRLLRKSSSLISLAITDRLEASCMQFMSCTRMGASH